MKIRLLWVGKTKERWIAEGVAHYQRLLGHMATVELLEIKEERGKQKSKGLELEGKRILKQSKSYMLLDELGKQTNSMGLAKMLKDKSTVEFVIGGAYGVSDEVRKGAVSTLALSKMTFTHELARVIMLEQLYRALMINSGREAYHH